MTNAPRGFSKCSGFTFTRWGDAVRPTLELVCLLTVYHNLNRRKIICRHKKIEIKLMLVNQLNQLKFLLLKQKIDFDGSLKNRMCYWNINATGAMWCCLAELSSLIIRAHEKRLSLRILRDHFFLTPFFHVSLYGPRKQEAILVVYLSVWLKNTRIIKDLSAFTSIQF